MTQSPSRATPQRLKQSSRLRLRRSSRSPVASHKVSDAGKTDETIEEIRFYLAHGMPEQAMAALAKLQTLTNDKAKLAEIRAEIDAATQAAAEQEAAAAAEPVIEELTADDIPTLEVAAEELPVEEAPAEKSPSKPPLRQLPCCRARTARSARDSDRRRSTCAGRARTRGSCHRDPNLPPAPGVLNEFVSDLESSLGDTFLPGTVAKPTPPPAAPPVELAPAAHTEPVIAAAANAGGLGRVCCRHRSISRGRLSLGRTQSRKHPRQQPQRSLRRCLPRQDLPRLRLRWSLHESLHRWPRALLHPPPTMHQSRRRAPKCAHSDGVRASHAPVDAPSRSRLSFRFLTLLRSCR